MNQLLKEVTENIVFVLEFLAMAAALFSAAYYIERRMREKNKDFEKILSTRKIAMIGVFAAISGLLMFLEFPVPFAPPFYELDFSEIPALVGAFAFGPVAGLLIELCKIIVKLFLKGTSTAFVGDMANFVIGCSFILPASILYMRKKTKKNALIGAVTGTVCMTLFGSILNAVYLLPKFAQLYGLPLDSIVEMGSNVNGSITNVSTLVLFAVVPLNIIKGVMVSSVTLLIYKQLSPILKEGQRTIAVKQTTKNS